MMNHIKSIFNKYKDQPKFIFGFHGELSHDSYNDIGVADEDVLHWIRDLKEYGHLNNTILILMSDHGHRYAT
jgi:membrane-anchored protein YejM (alkaline phosphatase superfamily)